jgi:hypothetical protein
MKFHITALSVVLFSLMSPGIPLAAQLSSTGHRNPEIEFPDIPGYRTLKCDFHMHTVFSDGDVWPGIRVEEAIRDGLDAISITDHVEYQPHDKDITLPDRNRPYQLALQEARNSDLLLINGAEITRSMPPGHFNAIFVKDANALDQKNVMDVLREAKRQEAFVFWNHPHWTSQKPDGVATLTGMHHTLLEEGLFSGIEICNETTYSDEALDIAEEYDLTILGNSDIHGLIDWEYDQSEGEHRPVTLVFASEKTEGSLREALRDRRTVVWFDNTLVGDAEYLVPLVEQSMAVTRFPGRQMEAILVENWSGADYILENQSEYTFHDHARVFVLKAHGTTRILVKTIEIQERFELRFKVLNAFTSPDRHPVVSLYID